MAKMIANFVTINISNAVKASHYHIYRKCSAECICAVNSNKLNVYVDLLLRKSYEYSIKLLKPNPRCHAVHEIHIYIHLICFGASICSRLMWSEHAYGVQLMTLLCMSKWGGKWSYSSKIDKTHLELLFVTHTYI